MGRIGLGARVSASFQKNSPTRWLDGLGVRLSASLKFSLGGNLWGNISRGVISHIYAHRTAGGNLVSKIVGPTARFFSQSSHVLAVMPSLSGGCMRPGCLLG